jgi:hypothetical protein
MPIVTGSVFRAASLRFGLFALLIFFIPVSFLCTLSALPIELAYR